MCKMCFLQNALFTFSKTLLSNQAKKCKWLSSWIQTILYEHEAGTIFFWVIVVKSSSDSQVTQKTAEKFWIPQMTVFLISNPKTNYCFWIVGVLINFNLKSSTSQVSNAVSHVIVGPLGQKLQSKTPSPKNVLPPQN